MDRFDEMRTKGINTNDATATSNDIRKGQTAYVKGKKVVGTLEGGGEVIIPPEAGTLTNIIINKMPQKLDYQAGEYIDLSGIEVVAVYDNDVYGIVTGACTFTVSSPLTVYDKEVIVSYNGFETSFGITVYGYTAQIPKETVCLFHCDGDLINEIDKEDYGSSPTFTEDNKFGTHSNIGAIITKTISNSTREDEFLRQGKPFTVACWVKAKDFHFVPWQINRCANGVGGISLNIYNGYCRVRFWYRRSSFNTYWSDYVDTPNIVIPDNIEIQNNWIHTAVVFKESVMKVFINGKLLYSEDVSDRPYTTDGDPKEFIDPTKASTGAYSDPNSRNNLKGYVDEFIVVNEALYENDFIPPTGQFGDVRTLTKIYMESEPLKKVYASGEKFDKSGMIIKAVYSDGLQEDVTGKCEIENPIVLTGDEYKKVNYTYNDVTKSVNINIGCYTVEPTLNLSNIKLLLPFDGLSKDITSNNDVEVYGADTFSSISEGKFRQAKYFNGTTDYISMPYTEDLNIDTGDFTIAFWCKPLSYSKTTIFITTYCSSYGWRIYLMSGGKIVARISTDTSDNCLIFESGKVNLNEWYHVALVRKGNDISLYVDGKLASKQQYENSLLSETVLRIGAWKNSATDFYKGYIDDLIITKSALWETEFTPPTKAFSEIM